LIGKVCIKTSTSIDKKERMETTSIEHILIQSRITILDLLERRGYDSTPYRKLLGPEFGKMIGSDLEKLTSNPEHLRMTLVSKTNPDKKAIVEYTFHNIKTSVGTGDYVLKMLNDPPDVSKQKQGLGLYNIDPKTTEVIVLYMGKDNTDDKETPYDKGALEAWNKHQFKIQFFPIVRLVCNPLNHVLQPKFEIVPKEEHAALKKEWYANSITQFPIIKFHVDMAARCLGLLPLDIVKITSYSPTSGEYVKYRVCAP
jgi:DNA-directed RNA polymerase subunit H (RpoH/RPB5)